MSIMRGPPERGRRGSEQALRQAQEAARGVRSLSLSKGGLHGVRSLSLSKGSLHGVRSLSLSKGLRQAQVLRQAQEAARQAAWSVGHGGGAVLVDQAAGGEAVEAELRGQGRHLP